MQAIKAPTSSQSVSKALEVSIVVPIYNDGYLVEPFCEAIETVFREYLSVQDLDSHLEVIFVNDGSPNNSADLVDRAVSKFKFVQAIHLSRNFGQHIAVSCGYQHTSGRYVVMMNVDQEDPPDQIVKMIDHLKTSGCDIVHGLYDERRVSLMNRVTSHLFGLLLNFLTGYHQPLNASTARVMTRRFVDRYNSLNERQRYIPGLEMWLGFTHVYIPIKHRARRDKKSSYNLVRRLKMAIDAVISFSDLPLKMASLAGFAFAFLGFFMNSLIVIKKLSGVEIQLGFTSTISTIVLFGGMSILVTGLAGIYIGSILREVQRRPLYVIRRSTFEGIDRDR